MGMTAILVIWPRHYEQTFVPLPLGGSTCNLVSVGPTVSEEMLFENVDDANVDIDADADTDGGKTTAYPINSPKAFGSGELKISTICHLLN